MIRRRPVQPAFAAAGVSGGDPLRTGMQGFAYAIRTAILPFIFIFHTELLMIGTGGWLHLTIMAVGAVVAMTVMLPVGNEPTAFSQYSEGILGYAADLTQSTGATLLEVNVINQRHLDAVDKMTSFGYKVDISHYMESLKKERREELEKMMSSLTLAEEKVSPVFTGSLAEKMFRKCPAAIASCRDDAIAARLRKKLARHRSKREER